MLTRTEEILLIAVLELGDNAYGATIRQHIQKLTGKRFSIGGIYVPLERLQKRGLLTSEETEPLPERGGRRKRVYRITVKGLSALKEIRDFSQKLWANMPNLTATD